MKYGIEGYDFYCLLHEKRARTFGKEKKDTLEGYCYIQEDKLIIKKIRPWKKLDMGDKIIPYANINAIDFDKAGGLVVTNSIVISISGFEPVVLRQATEQDFQQLNEAWLNFNSSSKKPLTVVQKSETTSADELMKYAELYKQGLLTEEEFETKKKELL